MRRRPLPHSWALFLFLLLPLSAHSAPSEEGTSLAEEVGRPATPGTVYVYCHRAHPTSLVRITLDGEARKIRAKSFVKWEVQPGRYRLRASSRTNSAIRNLQVESGESYYFEHFVRSDMTVRRLYLTPRRASVGEAAVQSMMGRPSSM